MSRPNDEPAGLDPAGTPHAGGRWKLIRDAVSFQLKLLVDGLRDVVFAPASMFLAFLDLLTGGDRFYRLLHLGRRSEQWINLFGRYSGRGRGMDEAVEKVEALIADQYQKGGITASAKNTVDKALNKLSSEPPEKHD